MKKNIKKVSVKKNPGITLISVILISILILTAVMGLANVLSKELFFVADTLNGERAYFTAESGVEVANLKLLENPIYHGNIDDLNLEKATSDIKINNLISNSTNPNNFTITLEKGEQQTIRLKSSIEGADEELTILPTISTEQNESDIFWTIRCKGKATIAGNEVKGTISLRNDLSKTNKGEVDDSEQNKNNYGNRNAGYQKEIITVAKFFLGAYSKVLNRTPNTCTLSFENLSNGEVTITVKPDNNGMAPEIGTVTATGTAQSRTKKIQFKTYQSKVNQWINWGAISKSD